jgi:hypothetical protein
MGYIYIYNRDSLLFMHTSTMKVLLISNVGVLDDEWHPECRCDAVSHHLLLAFFVRKMRKTS